MNRFAGSIITFFILTVLISSLVFACAGPTATTTPSTTTIKPTQAGPKSGGTLRLSTARDPNRLDPIQAWDAVGAAWAHLYSSVPTRWQGKDDSVMSVVPWMAKSWEVSPDGMTFTWKLHEGIKWQNIPPVNGRELTAEDVTYSINRIADVKNRSPLRPYLATLNRLETVDKYTYKVIWNEPNPQHIMGAGSGNLAVVAKEVADPEKTWIGPGPFVFKSYEKGVKATFERNPNYWEKGKPYLDKVEIYVIPDESARLAAFRAGQLDRMYATSTAARDIEKSVPGAQIVPGVDARGVCLYFGMQKFPKPWGDARVRQAVAYALDYDGLIKAGLDGAGYRSDLQGPRHKEFGARTGADLPNRDVTKAKALLKEAGYPDGFKTTLIGVNTAVIWGLAEPIAAMLKDVGIQVELKPGDSPTVTGAMQLGDFDMGLANALLDKPETDMGLQPLYGTKGSQNFGGYSVARVDELISLEKKAYGNPAQRTAYLKELMAILQKDQPCVPICVNYQYNVMQSYVRGWENQGDGNSMFGYSQIMNVWFDK